MVRFVQSVFMGEKIYGTGVKEVPFVMYGPMIFAACFLFVFGILPQIPLRRLVSPAIQQIGLESRPVIPPGFIITPVGYWNPVAIAFTALLISLILMGMLAYLSKKVASRPKISVEALKPFLSGEDVNVLDSPMAFQYYHVFSHLEG